MIRRGRQEGWLKYPINRLEPWAKLSGVTFDGVKIGPLAGFESRGSSVIATRQFDAGPQNPLVVVPQELVLSLRNVQSYAKRCKPFGEILDALGDFGRVCSLCDRNSFSYMSILSCYVHLILVYERIV